MANRYLLTVILNEVAKIADVIDSLDLTKKERKAERKEKFSHTLSKEKKEEKKERKLDRIEFQFFTLKANQFKALTNEFGASVTSDACTMLDRMIGTLGYSTKQPARKLKQICEELKIRDSLYDKVATLASTVRKFDYHLLETKADAMKYIYSTPSYLRNVDEGVKYLSEKFSIDVESIRRT